MAHVRSRHIVNSFLKLLKFSPIVGVFGHRQVGKSTFIAAQVKKYSTLDDVDHLNEANHHPKEFIKNLSPYPAAIDECQMEPKLFPTLKEWVRVHPQPGQFVLSGSVRFTSRKAIKESLAGRMSSIEMFPLTVSELISKPLSEGLPKLIQQKYFSQDSLRYLHSHREQLPFKKGLDLYLENGGLPGLCFVRNQTQKKIILNDLHDLMLSRDLKLIGDIRVSVTMLKKLLGYIASRPFEPYLAAEVRRQFGLAPQTQKALLFALESIFLIRRIPIPLRKKELILLEDQFEEWMYSQGQIEKIRQIETAVYRNIRTQFAYTFESVTFESFLTRDYARVPLVLVEGQNRLGVLITDSEQPTLSEVRSANSFLRHYGFSKMIFLSTQLIQPQVINDRTLLTSVYSVL